MSDLSEFSDFLLFCLNSDTQTNQSDLRQTHGSWHGMWFKFSFWRFVISLFTFIFSLSLFLFLSCSHPALFCLPLLSFAPSLFAGSLFFCFLMFSTFFLSLSLSLSLPLALFLFCSVLSPFCLGNSLQALFLSLVSVQFHNLFS